MHIINTCQKIQLIFYSDDSLWVTSQIKSAVRRRQRENRKHGRSDKWNNLDDKAINLISKAKTKYNANVVQYLKKSNEGQWYSKHKQIARFDIHLTESV